MFHGYWLNGLHFDPPNSKNSIFESLSLKRAILMHIGITGSLIPIPFLPTTLFRYVGSVINVSWLSDQRFALCPPKPQKRSF